MQNFLITTYSNRRKELLCHYCIDIDSPDSSHDFC